MEIRYLFVKSSKVTIVSIIPTSYKYEVNYVIYAEDDIQNVFTHH